MLGRAATFFFFKATEKGCYLENLLEAFFSLLSGEKVPILEVVQSGHSPLWGWTEVADGSGDHRPRVRVRLIRLESAPR